jgi:hypothetical protein
MNIQRLRKLAKYILAYPSKYDQNSFCGTQACLAGHAAILAGIPVSEIINDSYSYSTILNEFIIKEKAQKYLQLTKEQGERLFSPTFPPDELEFFFPEESWPEKFNNRYEKAKTPRTRAKIAAQRIEHFIQTKGRE